MGAYLPKYLKEKNRLLVLELFRSRPQWNRAEIARATGMSFPTVTKAVDAFLAKGLLQEIEGPEPSAAGRPGHTLAWAPHRCLALGVECEGNYATAALVGLDGQRMAVRRVETGDLANPRALETVAQTLAELRQAAGDAPVLGVGLGFPANIDPATGQVVSYQQRGVREATPLDQLYPGFTQTVALPLILDNDVNFACQGEALLRREERITGDMLYLSVGSGCGGALRLGGKLCRGGRFRAGEVGALRLRLPLDGADGPTLEECIGLRALEQRFGMPLREGRPLSQAAAEALTDYVAPLLAGAIYQLTMALDLSACILAGILPALLGPALCSRTQALLTPALPAREPVQVAPSVSREAGVVGAAAAVFTRQLPAFLDGGEAG